MSRQEQFETTSERISQCEDAIGDRFHKLVAQSRSEGWTRVETCVALADLADQCALSTKGDQTSAAELQALISEYMRRDK